MAVAHHFVRTALVHRPLRVNYPESVAFLDIPLYSAVNADLGMVTRMLRRYASGHAALMDVAGSGLVLTRTMLSQQEALALQQAFHQ